jgi:hypothetical protein
MLARRRWQQQQYASRHGTAAALVLAGCAVIAATLAGADAALLSVREAVFDSVVAVPRPGSTNGTVLVAAMRDEAVYNPFSMDAPLSGFLFAASPRDACVPALAGVPGVVSVPSQYALPWIALIDEGGNCSAAEKVRAVIRGGAMGAFIVSNDESRVFVSDDGASGPPQKTALFVHEPRVLTRGLCPELRLLPIVSITVTGKLGMYLRGTLADMGLGRLFVTVSPGRTIQLYETVVYAMLMRMSVFFIAAFIALFFVAIILIWRRRRSLARLSHRVATDCADARTLVAELAVIPFDPVAFGSEECVCAICLEPILAEQVCPSRV